MPTFTPHDAATVCRLLQQLGSGAGIPSRIRTAARYWADEISPDMPRENWQALAWLLQDAGAYRRIPQDCRDEAQYWAAYLEDAG
jgi:hypothetical protein